MTHKPLLPGNATAWERSNAEVSGERMLGLPVSVIRRERDPLACDAAFLPGLGWERSVHYWDPSDSAGNRSRTSTSFPDHLVYGCPAPLEAEIALDTGQTVSIKEWFEVAGLVWPLFHVDVAVVPGGPYPDTGPIIASALARKPVRDVLAQVRYRAPQPAANVYVGASCSATTIAKILPADGLPPPPQIYVGAGNRTVVTAHIAPLAA